jgi:hypothetical protein
LSFCRPLHTLQRASHLANSTINVDHLRQYNRATESLFLMLGFFVAHKVTPVIDR